MYYEKSYTATERRQDAHPGSGLLFVAPGGDLLKNKLKRLLLSERGHSSYISSFIYILVAVILIAFIINVFHIISVKQEMDHIADQIVKQIQLNGGTSGETDSLFSYLSGEMSEAEGLAYQVSCSGSSSRIQIGSPFYVTVTGRRCQRALLEVKEEPMHKKIILDERGDLSFFTVFVILAINMLLAFVLLFASVRINCINIRNAAKMELNNVSARIYADTFHSQREADLHLSSAYQEALRAGFILGMEERIQLTNDDYTVNNINLQFNQYSDKIEYVVTCDATFRVRMFGNLFPPITQHIMLTGSHNTKY